MSSTPADWQINAHYFSRNFHYKGYSGHALRLAQWAFTLSGVSGKVKDFTSAVNVHEQDRIWKESFRAVVLGKWLGKILGSPAFLWNALGVPINQMNVLLEDGTIADFVKATFDPIPRFACMSTGGEKFPRIQMAESPSLISLFLC